MRVLGITFTKSILFDKHIQNTINKLKKINNIIKTIRTKQKGSAIKTSFQYVVH